MGGATTGFRTIFRTVGRKSLIEWGGHLLVSDVATPPAVRLPKWWTTLKEPGMPVKVAAE